MRNYRTQLKLLQRELERQQREREGQPQVHTIEVYCGDELREVRPLGAKVIARVNVDIERL